MIKDLVLLLMVMSGIAALLSIVVFRKKGAIYGIWGMTSRRGIAMAAICLELMMFWGGIAMLIDNPSSYLTAIGCFGGIMIVGGIYFTLVYFSLPRW
jgi:hypothetical protein